MTQLSQQIRELTGKADQFARDMEGWGTSINRHEIELQCLTRSNLPTILAALELAERLDAQGCVEVVAKVLYEEKEISLPWDDRWPTTQERYKRTAQAAISAMKGERG